MSRHFFPGGNTPKGFFSCFGSIPYAGERTIYLKGASGSGKSTFMRKAALAFEKRGFAVEFFRCSNDPGSLDGVRVPGLFCIVDGTAPHVQDPAIPVAYDELFNMAAFIDPNAVAAHGGELRELAQEKKQLYDSGNGYLAAAWAVYQNNVRIYGRYLNRAKLNKTVLEALTLFDGQRGPGGGGDRRLFAAAVTPEGFTHTLDSLMEQQTIFILKGEIGMGMDIFLKSIRDTASLRGFACESLLCPLDPGRLDHLIIPGLGLAFFTSGRLWAFEPPANARVIDLYDFLDSGIAEHGEEIAYNNVMFDELAGRAVRAFAAQRRLHDRAEEIFISGMDFGALNEACEGKIAELLVRVCGK